MPPTIPEEIGLSYSVDALVFFFAAGGFFAEKPPVVGLCLREEDNSAWTGYYRQLQTALEEAGYVVAKRDASNDQAMQNLQKMFPRIQDNG